MKTYFTTTLTNRAHMTLINTQTRQSKLGLKMQNLVYSFGLVVLLSACGGGGDGDSSAAVTPATPAPVTTTPATPTTPTTPVPEPSPEVEPTPDATSIDDLVVDPGFDMQAAFNLTIEVDLASSKRGYFSLCDDYQQQGQSVTINFESCLLRGALDNGQLTENLLVANHQRQLMAVVWFYDGTDPLYQQWQFANVDKQQLLIN